jgi:hypothetical protein
VLRKDPRADPAKIKALEADLDGAIEKAKSFVVDNLYPRTIEENGDVGMNANTGEDSTNYFYNCREPVVSRSICYIP